MDTEQLALQITVIWNKLAKDKGWPSRKEPSDIERNPRVITKTLTGLNLLKALSNPPNSNESITWMFLRWNWNKTPAPLNLLENQDQWKALLATLKRSEEEIKEAREGKITKLKEWAKKEFSLGEQKGLSSEKIIKDIEEFAHATKKTQGLTIKEKLQFSIYLEDLENLEDLKITR